MTSQELDYLAELMAEFPVEGGGIDSVKYAESLLQLRYQALLDTLVDSGEILEWLRSIQVLRQQQLISSNLIIKDPLKFSN